MTTEADARTAIALLTVAIDGDEALLAEMSAASAADRAGEIITAQARLGHLLLSALAGLCVADLPDSSKETARRLESVMLNMLGFELAREG